MVEIQCAEECNISVPQNRIFNIVQDIVYAVSTHVTPKHVRLGSTLHQVTRSKRLVELFSNAGHIMNYNDILRLDTALAEKTLESMKYGPIIPPNLVLGRFVHFTTDNIDINDIAVNSTVFGQEIPAFLLLKLHVPSVIRKYPVCCAFPAFL